MLTLATALMYFYWFISPETIVDYVTFTSKKTSTWDPKNHVSYNYNKNCSRKFADVLLAAFIVETYIRTQKNKKYWFWYDTKQS